MATAPFTPFYNTPYAYPSSATAAYPPPASGSFPAPAYGPYSFPSTTTYPPPPYPGGYYTSPFPYAATYSYPPPTSACTPAAGFSPAPAYGPSTYPCAAVSPCLTSAATPISTNAEPNWPPPAPESSHITSTSTPQANSPTPTHDSVQFSPPPPAGRPATAPLGSPDQVPGSPLPTNLSRPTPQWRDTIPAAPNRASCKSQRHTSSTSLDPSFPNPSTNLSSSKAVFHSSASRTQQDIELLLKFPDRDALPKGNNKKQADDQLTGMEVNAAVQAAVDESVPAKNAIHRRLQRELLNIQARLDQQQARDRTALYTLQGELAKFKSMASQLAVAMGMQTTDAPVSGASPAVLSAPVSSSAPPIPSSTATSYVAPQMLDEMPQQYGLHNLERRSLFRADGTEHSYFTLPADYPLEQAVSEPVFAVYDDKSDGCSNEFVHVFASTPDPQAYEEEQQDSEQLLKCVGKAPETKQKIACPNYSSRLYDFTLEQQQQEDENAPTNVLQRRVPRLSLLVIHERRKEWDPEDIVGVLQNTVLQSMGGQVDCLNPLSLTIPWDPGLLVMHSWVTRNSTRTTRDAVGSNFFSLLSSLASYRECTENHLANQKLMETTSTKVAALTWHSSLPETPLRLLLSRTTYTWDPGVLTIIRMMLDKYAVSHEIQFIQWSAEFLFLSSTACMQYTAPNGVYSVLHSWYITTSVCLHVQYCCLQTILACPYSVPVCYYRKFSPRKTGLSAICLTTAPTVRMILVYSYGKVAQEGRDEFVVYQVFKIQTIRKTSHIWDPGIESMEFLYKGLHLCKIQLGQFSATHACYSAPACSPTTPISTQASSDTELDELTSPCVGFHLQQSTKWTSTSPNGIASSEYAYTMDFIIDQCEFLHNQGVQKNYNAKNLLSSPNYLQILELDIIFLTFLPP